MSPVLADEPLLVLRVFPPQQKHQPRALPGHGPDGGVGEYLPALLGVRVGLVCAHCEAGVEQQHPLCRPLVQVAVRGLGTPHVRAKFLVDILQARWHFASTPRDREAVPRGLSVVMVRVLAQDDHLDASHGAGVEGAEDVAGRWKHLGARAPLAPQKLLQVGPVLLRKLAGQSPAPRLLHQQVVHVGVEAPGGGGGRHGYRLAM
mmetsp:Transcript_45898/g.73461  ORF Transcript_45898/g.73461 Transcript_45898/m.73461 type:complete len:204 (+) Transcript_45898:2082-2693(+)